SSVNFFKSFQEGQVHKYFWEFSVSPDLSGTFESGCYLDGKYNMTDLATNIIPYPGVDVYTETFTIPGKEKIDLIAKEIGISPGRIEEDTNTIRVIFEAVNTKQTVNAEVEIKIDNQVVKKQNLTFISGKNSYTISFDNNFNKGNHNLSLKIDSNNKIDEANENNNVLNAEFEVKEDSGEDEIFEDSGDGGIIRLEGRDSMNIPSFRPLDDGNETITITTQTTDLPATGKKGNISWLIAIPIILAVLILVLIFILFTL
ncbi:MAG: CARDB domain-containing protein, partial [Nanoarchaeota archaeon]